METAPSQSIKWGISEKISPCQPLTSPHTVHIPTHVNISTHVYVHTQGTHAQEAAQGMNKPSCNEVDGEPIGADTTLNTPDPSKR